MLLKQMGSTPGSRNNLTIRVEIVKLLTVSAVFLSAWAILILPMTREGTVSTPKLQVLGAEACTR